MLDNISILAGKNALEILREEGLNPNRIKVLAGASGAAKFLVLTGMDRAILSMFKERTAPLYLIGTSIGAFRMAAYCQPDPQRAIDRLEAEYIAQRYEKKPSRKEITGESWRIINAYIDDSEIDAILNHPFMRISFLSNRCKGLLKSENRFVQLTGLILAAVFNRANRNALGLFLERALFYRKDAMPPFAAMGRFPISAHPLTKANFKNALLSTGSIPYAMEGVSDIEGAPGMYRDGGILDYHLDIPFLPENDGLVLYPHFYEHITPGWFDKSLNRPPDEKNMSNVVLVAPSKKFVATLPYGKIPDREDFKTFFQRDDERIAYWREVVDLNKKLGEEFLEAIESGKIREMVKPLMK